MAFYCEPCREAKNLFGILPTSYGKCEFCEELRPCHDRKLPDAPEPAQTWTYPPEPGPEVTHVRDRYKLVWHREDGEWTYKGVAMLWTWNVLFEKRHPLTDVSAEYAIDRDIFDGVR